MASAAQLHAWLEEAESALHQLALGRRSVKLSYDGESLEYTPAMRADLITHIAKLKSLLGDTTPGLAPRRGRARRVTF
jgi:hypothetical protein